MVVPVVPWHTQILADQLTLFQPGGTNYAHLITTGTPGFSYLPTALLLSFLPKNKRKKLCKSALASWFIKIKRHFETWAWLINCQLFEQFCEPFWVKIKIMMKPGFLDTISQHKVLVSLIFASQRLTHQRQRPFMFYSQYSRYIQNIHTKVIVCYFFFSFYHA